MEQNNPQDPKIITIVAKRPEEAVLNGVRPDESFSTIPCYIVQVQMVPLGESHSHTKISKEKVKRKGDCQDAASLRLFQRQLDAEASPAVLTMPTDATAVRFGNLTGHGQTQPYTFRFASDERFK